MTIQPPIDPESLLYPETDGEPSGEGTLHWEWVLTLFINCTLMYRDDPNVFVAAKLFWYPVEGAPDIRMAPDTMVVLGRPKGHRSTYLQWQEDDVAPQVVFEVQSPFNTEAELLQRFDFYQLHRVEEYYLWYPQAGSLGGWLRSNNKLEPIAQMQGHVSPRLSIRFDLTPGDLVIQRPNGRRFLTYAERTALLNTELKRREARAASDRADRLAAQLRELGIEPES